MSKKFSKNIIGLFLPVLIILMITGFPQFLAAAPNEKDVLFTFQPKYSDAKPLWLKEFGIDQAKIYIYKTGDAHGESKGNINQVSTGEATGNVEKGSWKYIFEGSYDSSSKRLTGDVRLSTNSTHFYKGRVNSRSKRDLKGKLEAKVNNSTLEGKVTSVINILQTPNPKKYQGLSGRPEKWTINLSWSFTADAGDTDEASDEKSNEEPAADDQISDLDKEILEEYGKRDSGAKFSGITGQVEIHIPGEPEDKWHLVKTDTEIPVGARIKTDEDSRSIIGFADTSTWVMEPGTQIIVVAPPKNDSKLKLVAGNIWANVKKIIKDGSMEVEMNQAVAGIKGTTFILEENGSSSTLKVIEGIVDFKSKKDGKIIKINAGEKIVATKDGLSEKSNFDVEKENYEWKKLRSEIGKKGSSAWLIGSIIAVILLVGLLIFKFIRGKS